MPSSARIAVLLLAAALAGLAGEARACGACAEDKVAAVYDHAVVEGAARRAHGVAFLAIEGPLPVDARLGRAVRTAIGSVAGVDRASVRVSLEFAACSAAFDPARASLETIVAEVNRRLAGRGLAVAPLRIGTGGSSPRAE
jgi:copper chaperone CopZ